MPDDQLTSASANEIASPVPASAALQTPADHCWYQVRIQFTRWDTAEHINEIMAMTRGD